MMEKNGLQDIELSAHAHQRAAQRNVSVEEIKYIVKHSKRIRRTGVIFHQFRKKDLPDGKHLKSRYERLVGTTVVVCKCGRHVVTLYRNGEAFHNDSRKPKYNNQPDKDCRSCRLSLLNNA